MWRYPLSFPFGMDINDLIISALADLYVWKYIFNGCFGYKTKNRRPQHQNRKSKESNGNNKNGSIQMNGGTLVLPCINSLRESVLSIFMLPSERKTTTSSSMKAFNHKNFTNFHPWVCYWKPCRFQVPLRFRENSLQRNCLRNEFIVSSHA